MSDTKAPAGATAPEPRPPKCPYCKEDMPIVVLYPYQIGSLILPSVSCPWCAVMLHIHIIVPPGAVEALSEPPDPKSRLWKPS